MEVLVELCSKSRRPFILSPCVARPTWKALTQLAQDEHQLSLSYVLHLSRMFL